MSKTVKEAGAEEARELPALVDAWLSRAIRNYRKGRYRAASAAAAIAQTLAMREEPPPILEPVVIHGLEHGRAVCSGENPVLSSAPGSWPAGHKWVDMASVDRQKITCLMCLKWFGKVRPTSIPGGGE